MILYGGEVPPPAGVTLGTRALEVEEGRSAGYTVALTRPPTGTVTVTPRVDDNADVTVSPPRLEFTALDWDMPRRITVSAALDEDDEQDAATVTHAVSGADYRGVTAADVRVRVNDEERSQGVLTARLSNGAEASYLSEAPRNHDGRPFRIRLRWSHVRSDGWQDPERAIGANRAIRVTGAEVRAVRVQRNPIGTPNGTPKVWVWDQAAQLLEFTPEAPGTDVVMVLEPLPCPGVHALCAWDENHRYTGLERRVRWTVEGIGSPPDTAPELTLSTKTEPRKELLLAQFTSVRTGSHYRVQSQSAGDDWTQAREWTGSRSGSGTLLVTINEIFHALSYDVRVRWENRHGAGPWSEVRTHDPSLAASLPPERLGLEQRPLRGEARLWWIPIQPPAQGVTIAKQQYRLARFPNTIEGFSSGGRGFSDNGWRDVPGSGTGQANESEYVLTGISDVWEVKAQVRTINSEGVVSQPSEETQVADPTPARPNQPPREVSNGGPDGVYGAGETIAIEIGMSRPVQINGAGTPSIEINLGGTARTATLRRIYHSTDHFYYNLPYPPWGRGDTLRFEYVVAENDSAPAGFTIAQGEIRMNGAGSVDAMRGGPRYGEPTTRLHQALGRGRPVRTARTAVSQIEWYGNQVWMHFDNDLDPTSGIHKAKSQFAPDFSVSSAGPTPVSEVRIVRGRGSSTRCGRGESGCRTVSLTLGQVYRPDPLTTNPWRPEPAADETVRMSYTPHAGLPKLRLRDTAGHDVEGFDRRQATALAAGTDPVLSVNDAHGREGRNQQLRFHVRLVPAATTAVTVRYATSDGTAYAGEDYTSTEGTLSFARGETTKSVSVPIIDDALEDSGETLTLALSNALGARIGDDTGTGTILNSEDLVQASFASLPGSHDGSTAFAFRLAFGEEVPVSAATLRDSALALTGGTVTGVRQVDAASRRNWDITVEPASDGDVTIALEPKESCGEAGAICAEDGRGLAQAVSATVPGPGPAALTAFTADFLDLPESHGGGEFSFELQFSEEPESGFSYKTLQGDGDRPSVIEVTNGTVLRAIRVEDGKNRRWTIRIDPDADAGDVTVTLPATTDCAATGAICAEGHRPLSAAVTATVPATAPAQAPPAPPEDNAPPASPPARVTASFSTSPPAEHDGTSPFTLRIAFSENLGDYSYKTMRDTSLKVMQGTTRLTPTKIRRVYPKDPSRANKAWNIEVRPRSKKDISIRLGPSPACDAGGAMCTEDDRAVGNTIAKRVLGPPGLAAADATVREAEGATLDFAVMLSRAAAVTVRVDYATSNGTAKAGEDYRAASGTLTFPPGETVKTVSVPVLSDDHNDGGETLTLTLSNPRGGNAWLSDSTATGTIENTGTMPRAWLSRFGRTVAEQVIEAVEGRMAAARLPGFEVTLAGESVLAPESLSGTGAAGDRDARAKAAADAGARQRLAALSGWLQGAAGDRGDPGAGPRTGGRWAGAGARAVTGRNLLTGSSFAVTGEAAAGGTVSLWGRGAVARFDGREVDLTLEGEVTSTMLGADWSRGPDGAGSGSGAGARTAGLLVSRSGGEGGYRGEGEATVSSSVTGLYPYGRYRVNDRVTVWGVAGYGAGTLTLTPTGEDGNALAPIRTDMDLTMGALGLRGVALEAPADGGVELAVNSDAMAVRTSADAVSGGAGGKLAAATAGVTRLRLGLEGTWRGVEAGGGRLTPRLEVGLRHDGGDAETGFGLDLGGGLAWAHAERGISADLSARGLLSHEAQDFRDRGISGSLAWHPGRGSGRGPRLTLTRTIGAAASGGMDALLGRGTLEGLAAGDNGGGELENRRLELKLGYGFSAFGDRFTSTPELGVGLGRGHREYTLGWRLNRAPGSGSGAGGSRPNALEMAVEANRREQLNPSSGAGAGSAPEHGIGFRVTARW